jgi:hypothetical protein
MPLSSRLRAPHASIAAALRSLPQRGTHSKKALAAAIPLRGITDM